VYYGGQTTHTEEGTSVATKTITRIEDDLDGSDAAETVTFGLDGAEYAIDLSDKNAAKLRGALEGFISKARKTGGRRAARGRSRSSGPVDTSAVRAWAASRGIEVNSRGRISQRVLDEYRAAGN
jgi:Lsr2